MIDKNHVKLTLKLAHQLVNNGKDYLVTNFHMKLPFDNTKMKYLTNSKREDKETNIRVNHDKGIMIWNIGQFTKDMFFKADLTFECINAIKELNELGKIILS